MGAKYNLRIGPHRVSLVKAQMEKTKIGMDEEKNTTGKEETTECVEK